VKAAASLGLLLACAGAPVQAATPELHARALGAVASVVRGEKDPGTLKPYFAKRAVFLSGKDRRPWDVVTFRESLRAGSCSIDGNYREQENVLSGLERGFAAELRKGGHPKGPGLTYYCAGPTSRAGASMMTFRFQGDKIVEVQQAYFVLVPPIAPPPPGAR
jgi:hypothetical protein